MDFRAEREMHNTNIYFQHKDLIFNLNFFKQKYSATRDNVK